MREDRVFCIGGAYENRCMGRQTHDEELEFVLMAGVVARRRKSLRIGSK
jgi:hypothetical protein